MIINGGEMAIFLGSAVVLTGTAVWGARRAMKGLIAMKKSGEYDAIAKEFKEKSTVLQSMDDSLQTKITLYNENVEPFCKLMAQDATLLSSYLQNYVAPILNNGMVKLLGTFSNLKGLRENALIVQARLNNDAVKLLMMANKIKRG